MMAKYLSLGVWQCFGVGEKYVFILKIPGAYEYVANTTGPYCKVFNLFTIATTTVEHAAHKYIKYLKLKV